MDDRETSFGEVTGKRTPRGRGNKREYQRLRARGGDDEKPPPAKKTE